MEITKEWLVDMNATVIHWNKNYNGGFFEYWFPMYPEAEKPVCSRVSVEFGRYPEIGPYIVIIHVPECGILCRHIKTQEQFSQFYLLMTGREL